MKILILLYALSPQLLFAKSSAVIEPIVYCDHQYKEGIVIVDNKYPIDSCAEDVMWGSRNVCYVGDGARLVDKINSKEFYWKVGFNMSDAELGEDGTTVTYWHASEMAGVGGNDLTPCKPNFFKDKEILNSTPATK